MYTSSTPGREPIFFTNPGIFQGQFSAMHLLVDQKDKEPIADKSHHLKKKIRWIIFFSPAPINF